MNCLNKYYLHHYKEFHPNHLSKLAAENVTTVGEFFMRTPDVIRNVSEMSQEEYEKVVGVIFSKCRPQCASMFDIWQPGKRIPTGIDKLDALLDGGICGGEILELCGLPSTGKTQFCIAIAAKIVQSPDDHVVLYLDLKNDFDSLRFAQMCQNTEARNRLELRQEGRVGELIAILENLENELGLGNSIISEKLRVIIVDALPMTFYPCPFHDDSSRLYQERMYQSINRLAGKYKIAAVLTNHVVLHDFSRKGKDPKLQPTVFEEKTKPALGQYWHEVPNFRLFLFPQDKDGEHKATLVRSSRTTEGRCFKYRITKSAIG